MGGSTKGTENDKNKDSGHRVGGDEPRTSEHGEKQTRNLRNESAQIANEISSTVY